MVEIPDNDNCVNATIKVIGIGGGGSNAIDHMINENVSGVEFICANTDSQVLRNSRAKTIIQLGGELTKGLGAGANPEIGRRAAEENRDVIKDILNGTDMVFLTAGMGGGTGTGATPVFAEIAKELGILTVAIVTKPFIFEGRKRMAVANEGLSKLKSTVDSLITIPNDKLLPVLGKNISLLQAFKAANDVLLGSVQGIAELITKPGLINVDFADVRTVMAEMGMAMMGTANARGDNRASNAAEAAISSPLLEDVDLSGAGGVLVNITAGPDMSIGEFEEVGEVIRSFTSEDAIVVVGTVIDPNMADELRVTVVITGLNGKTPNNNKNESTELKSSRLHQSKITEHNKLHNQGNIDYRKFDRPSLLRNISASTANVDETSTSSYNNSNIDKDIDYLDIPAFLRRDNNDKN